MLKTPFMIAITLAIAFAGGIWSTLTALDAANGFSAIRIGPWHADPTAQTSKADPYARANRAREGRLLYASAEGLMFTASTDGAGAPLDAACTYRLSGMAPTARLWTLFTLAPPASPELEPSSEPASRPEGLNSRMIFRQPDGSFSITLSPHAHSENWLALSSKGQFTLVMNLFDTPVATSTGISDIPMPEISKLECGDV